MNTGADRPGQERRRPLLSGLVQYGAGGGLLFQICAEHCVQVCTLLLNFIVIWVCKSEFTALEKTCSPILIISRLLATIMVQRAAESEP